LTSPNEVKVPLADGAATTALVYGASHLAVGAALVLGHGAGAGQRSAFMVDFANALSALGLDIITFNFSYTEYGRRIPDREPALEACYRAVVDVIRQKVVSAHHALFIGGKSMGGRIATHIAAADPGLPIAGLVLLGYPLHPPGKPAERRDKHLPQIHRPMLFVQGGRDAFGTPAQLSPVLARMRPEPTLQVVADGDHSFKLPRRDPHAQAAIYANIQQDIVRWIQTVVSSAAP